MIPLTTCVRDKQKPNEPFSHYRNSASALAHMKHSATCKIQQKMTHFGEITLINVFHPECILSRFKESLFFWMEPSSTSSCQGTRRGLLCSGEACCWKSDSALNGWVTIPPPGATVKVFELHHFLFRHKFDLRMWFMASRLLLSSDVICSRQKQKHRHVKFVPCHTPVLQNLLLFSGRFQRKLKERRSEGTSSAIHHFVMQVGYESEFSSRTTR